MKILPLDLTDHDLLTRVRQMPVFDALEEERLKEILQMTQLRRYEKDEVVITEGDLDETIYFLIMGTGSVSVDGFTIATLSQTGTIFGEMGVIDHNARSATVKAVKPLLCLVMAPDFLERLEGVDKLAAQALFYRIFSEKLSSRLRNANSRILELEERLEFSPA